MDKQAKKALTQDELRAMVEARKDRLQYHLAGLESEVTMADVTLGGRPVLDYVRERPLLAAGVAAGFGILAGLLYGLARREPPAEPDAHSLWMGAYLKDLVDDAAHRVRRGADADAALRRALRQRAPVVVIEEPPSATREARSSLGSAFDLVLKTAMGFGVKLAMDRLAHQLTGEEEVVSAVQHASEPEPDVSLAIPPVAPLAP